MSARAQQRMPLPVVDAVRAAAAARTVLLVSSQTDLTLRRAELADAQVIHDMLEQYVEQRILIPRTVAQICRTIREFVVVLDGDRIVGCGALKIYSPELAEICALAVRPEYQGHGVGRRVVNALMDDARALRIERVIALTLEDGFFHRLGFTTTDKDTLPEKVAADCVVCPKRHACDEIAVVRRVAPALQ